MRSEGFSMLPGKQYCKRELITGGIGAQAGDWLLQLVITRDSEMRCVFVCDDVKRGALDIICIEDVIDRYVKEEDLATWFSWNNIATTIPQTGKSLERFDLF